MKKMSKFWSQDLDNLTPYVPGEAPLSEDIIKLNTNENPFGPSEKVLNAMKSTIDGNLSLIHI